MTIGLRWICKGFSVRVSLSEKSKGGNLEESIDFRVRTE